MATPRNNRKVNRETLDYPHIAVIFYETKKEKILRFVNIMNLSVHGVLIDSSHNLEKDFELNLMIRNIELNRWDTFFSRVAWVQVAEIERSSHAGLEFLFPIEQSTQHPPKTNDDFGDLVTPHDLNFLLNTRFVNILPNKDICTFLNCLDRVRLKPGIRFITQGEAPDSLYLIQKGVCSIQIQNITVTQCREGDIIGETVLLTKGVSAVSILSESDMILWQLPKDPYDKACKSHPDMKIFLTELLANRIENSTTTHLRQVGHYVMTHRLGEGNASLVYKGIHQKLRMPVAIKMINHVLAMDNSFFDNLKRKEKRIIRLNHPNIRLIYDITERYRTIFIVMEYLDGESLNSLIERKVRLPFSRVLSFLLQIAMGLAHAHDQKIIHRDIRPANIFIENDDHIKLLDFGLACSQKQEKRYQTDMVHYMSPEQIKGNPVNHKTDIYSFGILAYELFTGKKPFTSEDKKDVLHLHTNTSIPDPQILVPDLPDMIKSLIVKACDKSPDQRYGAMKEIIEELILISQSLKEKITVNDQTKKEVTVLLISHTKKQTNSLNRLLDDFSRHVQKEGLTVTVTGKAQIT